MLNATLMKFCYVRLFLFWLPMGLYSGTTMFGPTLHDSLQIFLTDKNIIILHWLLMSPGTNPKEHLWDEFNRDVSGEELSPLPIS